MRLQLSPVVLAIVLASAAPCDADEVRLKNLDRYTGTVVKLEDGTLVFKTDSGELKIAFPRVTSLTVDHPLIARTSDGQLRTITAGDVDLANVVALTPPEPPLVWSGGANAGLLSTGGNTDVNNLRVDGDLMARARANRYTASTQINRAEDAGRTTARNWSLSARYDRFLSKRLYLDASSIFTNDEFRDLDLRTALGAAVGYQVLDTARAQLGIEGGIGWVKEDFVSVPDDDYTALRDAAKLDVFLSGTRVVLFHRHDTYFGVTGEDNLFFKTQNGVRFGLVAGLVTTLQLDLDYDRSPAPGRTNTDRTFALTFGYRF